MFAIPGPIMGAPMSEGPNRLIRQGARLVTCAADILEDAGAEIPPQLGEGRERALFVTPRDIDEQVRELSRVIGYAIDLALQPSLDLETLTGLMV